MLPHSTSFALADTLDEILEAVEPEPFPAATAQKLRKTAPLPQYVKSALKELAPVEPLHVHAPSSVPQTQPMTQAKAAPPMTRPIDPMQAAPSVFTLFAFPISSAPR